MPQVKICLHHSCYYSEKVLAAVLLAQRLQGLNPVKPAKVWPEQAHHYLAVKSEIVQEYCLSCFHRE